MNHYCSGSKLLRCFLSPLLGLLLLITINISSAKAQLKLNGFLRNYNAVQHQPDHDILIGRNRLRLDLNRPFGKGAIVASSDIRNLYSTLADSMDFTLREAYVDLYFRDSDLRIGRQMIVWGRAEGTFITDLLTPVDLEEFLTQDFADLRKGVTAINYTHYFNRDFFQLIVNPVFQPNEIPDPESRWFPRQIVPTSLNTIYEKHDLQAGLNSMQVAGRYAFRSNLSYDLDLMLLYWHDPNPSYFKALNTELGFEAGSLELKETYNQSFIAAYSGNLQLTERLLLTSESAFYSQKNFDYLSEDLRSLNLQDPNLFEQLQIAQLFSENSDGFLKEKPTLITMLGWQYELFDITISSQFVNEYIVNYDPDILQEEHYHYATLLLQRSFLRDTWGLQMFGRYNFRGKDYWINPELTYTGIDSFEAAVGSQVFGGAEPDPFYGHLSFKNYAESSFTYLKISAYF